MWGKKVYTTYLWWNWGLFMIVLPTKKPNYILWDSAVAIFASGSHVTEQSWVPRTTSCERAVLGAILSSSVFNSSVYQLNENCSKIISHSMLDKVIKILNLCIYIYIHRYVYVYVYTYIFIKGRIIPQTNPHQGFIAALSSPRCASHFGKIYWGYVVEALV